MTSGLTAIDTASDTAVPLISNVSTRTINVLTIVNTSGIAGAFRIDEEEWYYWPADVKTLMLPVNRKITLLEFKRVAGGSNVTGLFAWGI